MSSWTRIVPAPWRRRLKASWDRLSGRRTPLIVLHHRPARVTRRTDDFTLNLPGRLAPWAEQPRFRLDGGPWRPLPQGAPRAAAPDFVVELQGDELSAGDHTVEVSAREPDGPERSVEHVFRYDPEPPTLPLTADWSGDGVGLEVEDGLWDAFDAPDGGRRARPRPGHEGYDRVVIVAGAFPGARRVETDVVFRNDTGYKEWGFGVLPLWGGRPDDPGRTPRRGWLFSIAWYFNRYRGVGAEFSIRHGVAPAEFSTSYLSLDPEPGRPYRVVAECVPTDGADEGWFQRMKWWPADEAEPEAWIELTDESARRLPHRDYGVALVCYGCQAEFGPVQVDRLQD